MQTALQLRNEAPLKRKAAANCRYKSDLVCFLSGKGEGMPSPPKSFVRGNGTSGGYEACGWRYTDGAAWHLRVWPEFDDLCENAFVVTDGVFEPDTPNLQQLMRTKSFRHAVGRRPIHVSLLRRRATTRGSRTSAFPAESTRAVPTYAPLTTASAYRPAARQPQMIDYWNEPHRLSLHQPDHRSATTRGSLRGG